MKYTCFACPIIAWPTKPNDILPNNHSFSDKLSSFCVNVCCIDMCGCGYLCVKYVFWLEICACSKPLYHGAYRLTRYFAYVYTTPTHVPHGYAIHIVENGNTQQRLSKFRCCYCCMTCEQNFMLCTTSCAIFPTSPLL